MAADPAVAVLAPAICRTILVSNSVLHHSMPAYHHQVRFSTRSHPQTILTMSREMKQWPLSWTKTEP